MGFHETRPVHMGLMGLLVNGINYKSRPGCGPVLRQAGRTEQTCLILITMLGRYSHGYYFSDHGRAIGEMQFLAKLVKIYIYIFIEVLPKKKTKRKKYTECPVINL